MRDTYFATKELSKSAIDLLLESPALYKAWLEDKEVKKKTKALNFGSIAHTLTLEPEKFKKRYAIKPMSLTTKAGKEWLTSLPQGVIPITEKDYEVAIGMRESIHAHPQAQYLFKDYKAEEPVYWTREDGIPCKCKPDLLSSCSGILFCGDIKTTESVDPKDLQRTIMKYHYYRQAPWYLEGLKAVGKECEDFIFIFVEKKYPYLVRLCILDTHFMDRGKEECEKAVEILKICRATSTYRSNTEDIITISLPTWI